MRSDSDGDGVRNRLECFHGMNPLVTDGPQPVAVEGISEGWFHARYRRNPAATDVTERVLWTTNLTTGPWSDQGVVTEALGGDFQGWHRVRVLMGAGDRGKFLRLEVTE